MSNALKNLNFPGHTRRDFLKTLGLGTASLAAARGVTSSRQPNVLFIEHCSMDALRMGAMGDPVAHTPNLDRLASQGVLFRNAYCNSPQCCPSRASMWSGQHIHEIEAWNNYEGLTPETPTFQTHLKQAGYQTAGQGKIDYIDGRHSIRARVFAWTRAADIRLPQKTRPTPTIENSNKKRAHLSDWKAADWCANWLEQHAGNGERPFFLYCGVPASAPHPPYWTNQRWISTIDPDRVRVPPADEDDHPVMQYMRATKHTAETFSEKQVRAVRRTYYAMIAEADAVVGRLLRTVDELGLMDSTYIIFTGDHGDTNMQHQQTLKNSMYESSVRVPLIVTGPGVEEGTAVDDLVSLVDLFPTLMDMADLPKPEKLSGQSLMPLLTGDAADRRDCVLSQYHSNMANTGTFMLRRGPWKYVAYVGYDPQLFNLEKDPDELSNVASDRSEVVREMDDRLRETVDYEAVDAAAKAYDKRHFRKWREQLGGDEACRQALASDDLYGRYSDEWRDDVHYAKIKSWLGEA